jgi:hypothetical protein
LILACAFAACIPTIIAKTLKPPIRTCFIRTPPFRQENATLFIGSINNHKIKEADAPPEADFSEASREKSSSTRLLVPWQELESPSRPHLAPAVREGVR